MDQIVMLGDFLEVPAVGRGISIEAALAEIAEATASAKAGGCIAIVGDVHYGSSALCPPGIFPLIARNDPGRDIEAEPKKTAIQHGPARVGKRGKALRW